MIFIITVFAFLFRIILSNFGTYWPDMNSWIYWGRRLGELSFKEFYNTWSDYLPGYLYILYIVENLRKLLSAVNLQIPIGLLYKLPSILSDLGTGYLIYLIIKKFKKKFFALLIALIYLINPAVLGNSTLWGQADSFATFFILLAIYFLIEKKLFLSAVVFGFSCVIKPLALFLIPLIAIYFILNKKYKSLALYSTLSGFIALVSFIPFSNKSLIPFIIERFKVTLNQYQYTSLNAFNFWSFLSLNWLNDNNTFLSLSFQRWGIIIFAITYLLIISKIINDHKKGKNDIYFLINASCLIFFSGFIFLTRMHERHLFTIFPFLAIMTALNSKFWLSYTIVSLIYVLNLHYAYIWLTEDYKNIFSNISIQIFSGLQIVNFLFLLVNASAKRVQTGLQLNFLKKISKIIFEKRKEKQNIYLKVKSSKFYLSIILFFAFALRIWNIWYPQAYIFDEVYHGFTAQEMAKGNIKAWEWWNEPPKGFAYEWTHPPLAKLIMAAGVKIFNGYSNKSQYTFRLPAVFFGIGVIYLTYLLAIKLFRNERIALITAFLLSFDGLLFVMSRIGMADVYILFFILATIYFCLNNKYLLSGISLGLAIASKWTGIYLYPVIGLLFLKEILKIIKSHNNKKYKIYKLYNFLSAGFVCYGFIPIVVYLLVYLLFFTTGHTITQFIELQKQMWWYHTNLRATHVYQSAAYTWFLMIRPVWFWVSYQQDKIGNIYNLGNPFLWWSGLLFLPFAVAKSVKNLLQNRNWQLLFTILCYFIFWLPWIFSPRIMFLHHYLPSIPFLCLIIAWFLALTFQEKNMRNYIKYYLVAIIIIFFFFYPIYSGILLPKDWLRFIFWFPSWK